MKSKEKLELLIRAITESNLQRSTVELLCYMISYCNDDGFVTLTNKELMTILDVGKCRISQHLKFLRDAKLISTHRDQVDSRNAIYKIEWKNED